MNAAAGKDYCIKPGYSPNLVQATYDAGEVLEYWNESRIETSARFQYYVYRLCGRLIRKYQYASFLDVGSGPATKVRRFILPVCKDVTLVDQPSTGVLLRRLMPESPFFAVNLESPALDLGRKFDVIVCADVLEHLVDPDPCAEFIRRHLSVGGRAVFSTPDRDWLRGVDCNTCPKREHVREWNAREFAAYATSRGFVVETHAHYPMEPIPEWEFQFSQAVSFRIKTRRWSSCQATVCRFV